MAAEMKAQREFKTKSACVVSRPAVSYSTMVQRGSAPKPAPHKPVASKPAASKAATMKTLNQQQQQTRTPAWTAPNKQARPSTTPAMNLNSEVERLFGSNLLTVMKKVRSAVPPNYDQLGEEEKSAALATFIFQICN